MAKSTIGDVISRIRVLTKNVRQDAFVTDRMIYTVALKHAKWLMQREDSKSKILGFSGIIQTLDFVELEEVDKVEACCTGIKSGCTIRRTKKKLPIFLHGYSGPLIRTISSIDGSQELQSTLPSTFINIANSNNFKYNNTLYYWIINDYIYFPNLDWDAVRIEGIFEDDVSEFTCADNKELCIIKQDRSFNIPDYLLGELESQVLKDFYGELQIPADLANDKQNLAR